jgi:hypothetical protein
MGFVNNTNAEAKYLKKEEINKSIKEWIETRETHIDKEERRKKPCRQSKRQSIMSNPTEIMSF